MEIRNYLDVRAKDLQLTILKEFGYNVHIKRIQETKQKVIEQVYGSWEDSYAELPHLLNAIGEVNPVTKVEWRIVASDIVGLVFLDKFFWAFSPCIEVFQYCRYLLDTWLIFLVKAS